MNNQHKEAAQGGVFFIEEEGEKRAQIVYSLLDGKTLVIEHTEVDDDLKGQNIGYELVHRTVEYAREQSLKIVPVCSFAKAVIGKKPEWQDVLA